jgi:GNAT superfamily N-acetyltransferase
VITVRPVAKREHEAVGHIVLAAYDGVGRIVGPYRDELADTGGRHGPGSPVLVAVDDDTDDVLGTVTVVMADSAHFEHAGHGDGGMRMLAVAPSAQGRGVGTRLVDAALEQGRSAGWRRAVLTSMPWMHAAHGMYMRRGFVRRPDLDVTFPSGVGLTFQLDLTEHAGRAFAPVGPVPVTPPVFVQSEHAPPGC